MEPSLICLENALVDDGEIQSNENPSKKRKLEDGMEILNNDTNSQNDKNDKKETTEANEVQYDDDADNQTIPTEEIINFVNKIKNLQNDATCPPDNIEQLPVSDYDSASEYRRKFGGGNIIVPNERKAYYAILSLMLDPELLSTSTCRITLDNIQDCILPKYRSLMKRLERTLLYDC